MTPLAILENCRLYLTEMRDHQQVTDGQYVAVHISPLGFVAGLLGSISVEIQKMKRDGAVSHDACEVALRRGMDRFRPRCTTTADREWLDRAEKALGDVA